MDEWLFISLAKVKADAPGYVPRRDTDARQNEARVHSKAEVVHALDVGGATDKPVFRDAAALVGAALVNIALLAGLGSATLQARTPEGEVIVAQLEPLDASPVRASSLAAMYR